VLHIIPFSAFGSDTIDLRLVHKQYLPPIWCSGYNKFGYNVDGYYTTHGAQDLSSYVQVFRNGIVESAAGDIRAKKDQGFVVYAVDIENEIESKIANYMAVLSRGEVSPPMFVMLGGVRMHGTIVAGARPIATQLPMRRADLVFPAITLEDTERRPITAKRSSRCSMLFGTQLVRKVR
jgi:hypothetical protein